jgi:hypothetical protein
LVAVVLGRKVTGAILRPPQGLSGETQFENEPEQLLDLNTEADRHTLEDAVVVLLAGKIAEAEYWKQLTELYKPNVDSHRHDYAEIERLVSGFSFNTQKKSEYMTHCTKKAKDIILSKTSKTAIEEIAQKLSDTMSITRGEQPSTPRSTTCFRKSPPKRPRVTRRMRRLTDPRVLASSASSPRCKGWPTPSRRLVRLSNRSLPSACKRGRRGGSWTPSRALLCGRIPTGDISAIKDAVR